VVVDDHLEWDTLRAFVRGDEIVYNRGDEHGTRSHVPRIKWRVSQSLLFSSCHSVEGRKRG
jgi:hypothetical protein